MLTCSPILCFSNHISYSHQMTADPVYQVQAEKTQGRPCLDSHPAVSSTPLVEGPPLVTCPWATPIQAACRRRPPSRPLVLSTATATDTATLTTSSTMSITQHHSPRAPCPFKSRAAPWNDPVLCPHPALELAAAATIVVATQATTMTRYVHTDYSLVTHL